MSIVSSDLVLYNAADMPTDDTSTCGGAIDTLRRPDYTQMAETEKIDVVSSASGDTSQTVTITGRLADGSVASETVSLNGTTKVTSSNTYQRLLKVELSATCAGNVTVSGHTSSTSFRIIPAGERGFQAMFQQLSSDVTGGSDRDFYAKIFFKNTNGTLTLTSATVAEAADPSSDVTFNLAATLNDSGTTTNRQTSPGGTFDSSTKNVPNSGNLTAGSAIGVWAQLALAAGAAPLETTWTPQLAGQTV